ncbi:MAG TPA: LamG-like jellyroll fold domain-containing protein [Bryobacteraceae bacterium]|nr:LamG-like jellyroll fold domain-containing protein [Bryobacteraceae bacterium]
MTFRPNWTRSIQVFLAWSLALAALGIADGATYYVATTGSDTNSGAQNAPFRHLSKAAAVAQQPGDMVIVMDGTYDNEGVIAPNYVVNLYYNGTAGSPITFRAQNRGGAILDSMNTSTTTSCNGASAYFNLHNAAYVVIQGFVIQRGCDEGIHSNDSAHDITIKWNEIRNIANRTVTDQIGRDGIYLNATERNFTFDGNSFHDIGRTSGTTQLHFDHGIYSHADNVTIINNIFYNMNRGWSIQLADGASNWLVANNTFAFGNANGEAGQIMFWGSNTGIDIRNNIFYRPNSYAMTRYAATISCSFDHNMIYGVSGVMSDTTGCSVGANQIGADPKFVNPSSYDFHLQSGSPAIDSGMTLAAVTTDIDGTARPQGTAFDLGAREYVSSGTNPPVISGVFASSISTNSAAINWSTDKPATSSVQYGLGAYTSTTPMDPSAVNIHSVTLSNLTPSTLYHYRAASQDSAGNLAYSSDYSFTTAAAPPPPPPTTTTFSVSAASSSLSVAQGASSADVISATLTSGSATAVSFTTSALPAGITASFSSTGCTATCSTTLTFSASASATAGSSSVVVTATGSGSTSSATIALTINPTVATGLNAQWKMDEGSGTNTADASGNGNTGTLNNATWATSSYVTSVALSGSNSYVSVKESPSIELGKQLTVAFWMYATTNSNVDPRVVDKLYSWDVKLNGSNRLPQFSSGGKYAAMKTPLPLNTWEHVVFTFSSGILKGYINGVPVAFSTNTFTGTETLPLQMYGLFIGTDPSKTASFKGNVDDVRLYNLVLSDADVLALYSRTRH